MLGHGEPVRVKRGQRVLFHILNGERGRNPQPGAGGARFRVVALDGNPVPHPVEVPVLWIGTAERISAVVEMNHPGVCVLGDLADDDRGHGMGIVVEYAGAHGKPVWRKPPPIQWDYTVFGESGARPAEPDQRSRWCSPSRMRQTAGSTAGRSTAQPIRHDADGSRASPHQGPRYRLRMRNASDDIHPIHLHRHSFELTRIAGKRLQA